MTETAPASPLRRCVVTRAELPQDAMIRFVVGPEDEVVADLAGRLPGRGIWLSARRDVLETATTKGAFARAARQPVTVPEDLPDRVTRLLRRRCLDHLGLAKRSGALVSGADKVREAVTGKRAVVLVQAGDASSAGRDKVRSGADKTVRLVTMFSSAELGATLGRENAVHVALADGGLARRFVADVARLEGLMDGAFPDGGGSDK